MNDRAEKEESRKTIEENERVIDDEGGDIELPDTIPVLPARDLVAFPSVMMSFYVGRPLSVNAIKAAIEEHSLILIIAQKDDEIEDPKEEDLFSMGVVANVARVLELADDRYKLLVQGVVRARVKRYLPTKGYFSAEIEKVPAGELPASEEVAELIDRIQGNIQTLVEYEQLPDDMLMVVEEAESPGMLADVILAHAKESMQFAQTALEELEPLKRLKIVDTLLIEIINKMVIHEQIRDRAQSQMNQGQREYFLREQLKQIREELGESEEDPYGLAELRTALEKLKLPALVEKETKKQLKRLEQMHPENSDAALLRTYLEWITDLPWSKRSRDRLDLRRAKKVLDEDHYGLAKVKDRILEFLSVRKLNRDSKGPILCLVGPPGVGKTSLGRSVARALNRKFVRLSLGGMRDEAEIRGHRRTYVGALPGRIVQGLKQAGTKNPVFVLDELDKVGADFRGDPASALLEVLDPEQNKEFSDHYLNVPIDLSEVMFFSTANTVDTIPDALRDRLEVIHISGYTVEEKLNIAKKYLIPRQLKENGLDGKQVGFHDKALLMLIERYTREAGVRNLEREIGGLCRKIARAYAERRKPIKRVTVDLVQKFLGPTRYDPEFTGREDAIGLVTGLAWTIYGGDTLPVEASVAKGKGSLTLTGQLGDVMQESARAAMFYCRANASTLGLDPDFHEKHDIHIHCPAGATPKDGPSAGVSILTALVSSLSGQKVSKNIAMTGEITLRGNVLPVGGIKEKVLAAFTQGIKRVVIPADNEKDLDEVPKEQRRTLEFICVKHVSEVLDIAFVGSRAPAKSRRKTRSKNTKKKPTVKVPTQQ